MRVRMPGIFRPIIRQQKACISSPIASVRPIFRPIFRQQYTTNSVSPQERMIIGFTCKVCSTRSYKQMSKMAYTKGVVLIKCDGCKNVHLIADHLGWFDSQKKQGTIEDILAEKGETVKRVQFDPSLVEQHQNGQKDGEMLEWLPNVIDQLEKK